MARKKARRKSKNLNQQDLTLNTAMGIVGLLLLGFIYSFSQNTSHKAIPIEVNFPQEDTPRRLAADVYNENPIQNVKVEVLNGCGIKGIAAKTATFLPTLNPSPKYILKVILSSLASKRKQEPK